MNKKTRVKIKESLKEALEPPGEKEFIPLPKDPKLSDQELTRLLLKKYRERSKPADKSQTD
jgi:hypothetical protein